MGDLAGRRAGGQAGWQGEGKKVAEQAKGKHRTIYLHAPCR